MPQDRKFGGAPYRSIPRKRPLLPEASHLRVEPPQVFNKPLDHHNHKPLPPEAFRLRVEPPQMFNKPLDHHKCRCARIRLWRLMTRAARRVLLVGGDHPDGVVCTEYFRLRLGGDCEVESIAYCDDALQALSEQRFDVLLLFRIFARWRRLPSSAVRFEGEERGSRQRGIRFYQQAGQAQRAGRGREERLHVTWDIRVSRLHRPSPMK